MRRPAPGAASRVDPERVRSCLGPTRTGAAGFDAACANGWPNRPPIGSRARGILAPVHATSQRRERRGARGRGRRPVPGAGGDLGSILLGVQEGAGNARARVDDRAGRDRRGARHRAAPRRSARTAAVRRELGQRLARARANPFAKRLESELEAFTRRLTDARASGFRARTPTVLDSELAEIEDKLGRAEREEEAPRRSRPSTATAAPLSERTQEGDHRAHGARPSRAWRSTRPRTSSRSWSSTSSSIELQKQLIDNDIAVTTWAARSAGSAT